MIVFEILQAVIGLVLALFLPGFLLTKIVLPKQGLLETFAFSVAFSIALDVLLGLFLGANETMANLTGGLTEFNLWFYMATITVILGFILLVQNKVLSKK